MPRCGFDPSRGGCAQETFGAERCFYHRKLAAGLFDTEPSPAPSSKLEEMFRWHNGEDEIQPWERTVRDWPSDMRYQTREHVEARVSKIRGVKRPPEEVALRAEAIRRANEMRRLRQIVESMG